MIKATLLALTLTGCASGYYNQAGLSANYCNGSVYLTCSIKGLP